jgi:ubiquinone/menaquinone biosynthesis C-methylase UbiE
MDTWEESVEYDAMDFTEVNTAFAERAVALGSAAGQVLDVGTGTARIPILMCQMRPQWQVTGIDLSKNMLRLGAENIRRVGLEPRIKLEYADAKQMPYPDRHFDLLVSNSIVHHLPDPLLFFKELKRVLKPGGGILLRDLFRPEDKIRVDALVAQIGPEYSPHQRQLFRDSLCAAFQLEEVQKMIDDAGLEGMRVYQSSDRHWTAERKAEFS